MHWKVYGLGAALLIGGSLGALAGTLEDVKQRGFLNCAVGTNNPGFSFTNAEGKIEGFDVDECRAIAAAVFGDASKVKVVLLGPRDAFPSLQTGVVDVLAHRFAMTYNRNAGKEGFDFPMIFYFDGQGFMVRKSLNIKSIDELGGATICVAQGTTTERNIADYYRSKNLQVQVVTFADLEEARRAYDEGRCDAWSNDRGSVAARGLNNKNPNEHMILPETISRETAGPIVRKNDSAWADVVRWALYTMINAEELGVNSRNVDEMKAKSDVPAVRRMLGAEENAADKLGLNSAWAYNIIKQVGNYGEIWDKNLGVNSRLKLDRGINMPMGKGGHLYAAPMR